MGDGADAVFDLDELEHAVNYQRWVTDTVAPWLGERILEIGAGTGNMSRWLPRRERLLLTEPDEVLLPHLRRRAAGIAAADGVVNVERFDPELDLDAGVQPAPRAGSQAEGVAARLAEERLDTVVAFNVLEHIRDDAGTLRRLAGLLDAAAGPGGARKRIVLLVPAHQWAYGTLDATFEHHRRYSASGLRTLLQEAAPRASVTVRHFNLIGLPGWFITGRILKRPTIPPASIRIFEAICPYVRGLDDLLHTRLRIPAGQSLIGVAEWT